MCPRSALFIDCVWLNILVKRASNTCVTQVVNLPESHWTLKAKWMGPQFSGTSGRTHTVTFSARAGHWGAFPKDTAKGRMLDKPSTLLLTRALREAEPSAHFPTGKHTLSLFSFNTNRINIVLNINILFKNFQIQSQLILSRKVNL